MYATGARGVNEIRHLTWVCTASRRSRRTMRPSAAIPPRSSRNLHLKNNRHGGKSRSAPPKGPRPQQRSPQFGRRGGGAHPHRGAGGEEKVVEGVVSANRAGFGFVKVL